LFYKSIPLGLTLLAAAGIAFAQGLRFEAPVLPGFHPFDMQEQRRSPLIAENPSLLTVSTNLFSDSTTIDFEKRQITFVRHDSLGFVLWKYHYDELGDYLAERRNYALHSTWFQNALFLKSTANAGPSESLKLAWELPVQYPGWAQRVLGTDPPRLSINGSMRIKIGFEDQSRKDPGVEEIKRGGAGFVFDQSNQFTISGSVGRLININISSNTEGDLDMNNPLKNFKIEYKEQRQGELEDEIVQEVIAGYTGFSMPGTQLSGYSESKEGLFGIKIGSRLGPLMLTNIVSMEQGESQKLSVSNGGKGSAATTNTQKEVDFLKYRYFFLDTAYISAWNKKYAVNGGSLSATPPPEVKRLDVWRQIETQDEQILISTYGSGNVRSFYVDNPLNGRNQSDHHQFVRLQPERHYHLNPREGYIRLFDTSGVREQDIIAIGMWTDGDSLNKGVSGDSLSDTLYLIKPSTPYDKIEQAPDRFRLMWRNVYRLSSEIEDITKFKIRVYLQGQDVQDTVLTIDNKYISEILGLTDKNGEARTELKDNFNFNNGELIIPPFNASSSGNEPFANPAFGEKRDTAIYLYGPQSKVMTDDFKPLFSIETSGASKQTRFDLGIGVMESTVRVKADNALLTANTDYVFSPDIGTLELTSPRALAAQKIDIDYQRESLFTPERKIFLGSRAEMKLPFVSDNSLMGLSLLWQSSEVSQRVPRINQEPYSKLLLDFNTKLDFKPQWMTSIVNKLPLVKTEAQSSANVEFEIAHSRMNPNSSKQAFVDDFESSKQGLPMGEALINWFQASPPVSDSLLPLYPPAWDFYWFQPSWTDKKNRIPKDSVWKRDLRDDPNANGTDQFESVLRLHVRPAPAKSGYQERYKNAWAGVMQSIPISMSDRKRDQYFELLLKSRNNGIGKGRLRVQIGRMREDICIDGAPPNGEIDKEDTSRFWRDLTVPALDKGLDTLNDDKEFFLIPNETGNKLDTVSPSRDNWPDTAFLNDPAKDNYKLYDNDHTSNYPYVCRLQNNGISNNTEDIDNNGTVETSKSEVYHEFVIDLGDTNSPFIDKSTADKLKSSNGWRRYRLQLRDAYGGYPGLRRDTGVTADEWTNMRMVRLIWDKFDETNLTAEDSLILTGMQFVGNQWEAIRNFNGKSKIEVSTIGTRESEEYKSSLSTTNKILREENETGGQQAEQSLRLEFKDLGMDEVALVERSFSYQPLKVASYDSLTLVVYGKGPGTPPAGQPYYNGDIKFLFRFGTDTTTYYEYRRSIMPGWNNYIAISLKDVSRLKLDSLQRHPNDTINVWSPDSSLHIKAPPGRQPNFSNITWMALGVECRRSVKNNNSGELWVDELKVVGIKQFNGWSSRLNFQTQFADFLNLTGGLTYEGGDFKTMTDQDITRTGDSKLSSNFNLSTGIDKFMPKEWGVSMPIGGSFTSSLMRPQLKPNSDIYLTNNNKPDGFFEMARDVASTIAGNRSLSADTMTLAEHFETESQGESFFLNYSKNGMNSNPAVDLMLDRLSTTFQYNRRTNLVKRGVNPEDSTEDYQNLDTSKTYSGGIKYNLTPKDLPKWTSWKPFGENPAAWVPNQLKTLEFSLLPSRANLDLANANYSTSWEARHEPGTEKTIKGSKVFDINHGLQLDFAPIRPILDLSYSLNIIRNFPSSGSLDKPDSLRQFVRNDIIERHSDPTWREYYILERERSRSQKFKMSLNPQFFDWLTNVADYTADYSGSLSKWGNDSTTDYINGKVNTSVSFNSSLNIGSLLPAAADSGKNRILGTLRKGCDFVGFSSVNFTYSNNANLNNNYFSGDYLSSRGNGQGPVSRGEFMAYQLGLQGRNLHDLLLGDINDRSALGGMQSRWGDDKYDYFKDDNRSVNQSYQVSTNLSLTKPIDIRLSSISLRWNRSFNVRPDTLYYDTTRSFPEISFATQSGILDKIKIINRYVQGANLLSNFSIKRGIKNSSAQQGKEYNRSFEFSPLVQVDGTVKKWPITFNYQHTMGQENRNIVKNDKPEGEIMLTQRDGDNLSMNYDIPQSSGASTVKILKWTVPIKGRTSTGISVVRDHTVTSTAGEKSADNSSLSFNPHLSYVVTNNVTGTLEYKFSRTTDKGAITTSNSLALITEIRF
jgi:hypothetical protein